MKKLLLFSVLFILVAYRTSTCKAQEKSPALANGLALTPPMGWNSWNSFQCTITEKIVKQMADIMVSSGMAAVGYKYINVDDCWQNVNRTNGHVTTSSNFSFGIKSLADYVHGKGLKLGVYSCRGTKTCQERAGSYSYETTDANDYAAWGVDYLKYDNCFEAPGSNQQKDYEKMRDALKNSGRDIVFSICAWDFNTWAPNTGNLWRTAFDIYDEWPSL
ncbi:MAG: glycoside hydrolase family 27 protein, partial [Bacteroidetes bacterium]|nr:glycoside hydrolase family 27 protein [Bacteroidota bacterium]